MAAYALHPGSESLCNLPSRFQVCNGTYKTSPGNMPAQCNVDNGNCQDAISGHQPIARLVGFYDTQSHSGDILHPVQYWDPVPTRWM